MRIILGTFRRKPGSLEKKNRKGETALQSAAVKGDQETVRCLLEQGANPNTVDNAGWSPLHEASIAGRVHCSPEANHFDMMILKIKKGTEMSHLTGEGGVSLSSFMDRFSIFFGSMSIL